MESPFSCEFELIDSDLPDIVSTRPLKQPASLTIRARMRKIHSVSETGTTYCLEMQTREELADSSPFFFDKETGTIPIAMATLSECQEIFDDRGKLIGFVSFDEHMVLQGYLFCAHISALCEMRGLGRAYTCIRTNFDCIRDNGLGFRRVGLAELNHE